MQPLPHLERCLALAYDGRGGLHVSGIALASYFVRAPTRGRRRADLQAELLFPESLRRQLGAKAAEAVALAMDPATFRGCPTPRPSLPVATREWLAEAALALGQAEGFPLMWALLGASSELEDVAHKLIGQKTPRSVVRQVLHGVTMRALGVEPFAALLVRVLKITQAVYAAFRHAGAAHGSAWEAVQDRLWSPHPTGRGAIDDRGAYLPSLVQAASGNARRRLRRNTQAHRTVDHAQALLARFASSASQLWPWSDASGRLLPEGTSELSPGTAGLCFFLLLTHTSSERRARGGPAGGLAPAFAQAGFSASEWLPDRTDDLAIRLLAATETPGAPAGDRFEALSLLLRATLGDAPFPARALQKLGVDLAEKEGPALLERARARLPGLLRWLEENARELLEAS